MTFGNKIQNFIRMRIFGKKLDVHSGKKDVDEGLNPFLKSLCAFDQKTWYANEVY